MEHCFRCGYTVAAHPPARERFIFFQLFDGEKIKDNYYFKDDYNNARDNKQATIKNYYAYNFKYENENI